MMQANILRYGAMPVPFAALWSAEQGGMHVGHCPHIGRQALCDVDKRGDVIGVCPDPDSCFEFGDRVRCGPCAVKASAAKGIAIDDTHSHLPEVCRLRRQVRELEARLAAALESAAAVAEAANVYELPSHAHIVGAAIRRLKEGLEKTGEGCGEYGCGPGRIMDVVSAIMGAGEAADVGRDPFDVVADWHDKQARTFNEMRHDVRVGTLGQLKAAEAAKHHAGSAAALRLHRLNEQRKGK